MSSPYWEKRREERERIGVEDVGEWLKQDARKSVKAAKIRKKK